MIVKTSFLLLLLVVAAAAAAFRAVCRPHMHDPSIQRIVGTILPVVDVSWVPIHRTHDDDDDDDGGGIDAAGRLGTNVKRHWAPGWRYEIPSTST